MVKKNAIKPKKKETLCSDQKELISELLINLVREHPMFYDKKHLDFFNKDKKKFKWNELKENLNRSLKSLKLKKGMFGGYT